MSMHACRHVLEGHGGWVCNGASSLLSHALVTAGGDNLAVAWDAESGACTNVMEGHSGPVTCIALTRKARHVLQLTSLSCRLAWKLACLLHGHSRAVDFC